MHAHLDQRAEHKLQSVQRRHVFVVLSGDSVVKGAWERRQSSVAKTKAKRKDEGE
jgi:hypothetical protein